MIINETGQLIKSSDSERKYHGKVLIFKGFNNTFKVLNFYD